MEIVIIIMFHVILEGKKEYRKHIIASITRHVESISRVVLKRRDATSPCDGKPPSLTKERGSSSQSMLVSGPSTFGFK